MRDTTLRIGTLSLAGLVATGLLAIPVAAAFASPDDQLVKRDEDTADVVLVSDDDDDDDTNGNTNTGNTNTGTNTGATNTGTNTGTGDQNDPTNSRVTNVSRDADRSRGDLTRDVTNDGPGSDNRDWSQNHTNDASRNDTR